MVKAERHPGVKKALGRCISLVGEERGGGGGSSCHQAVQSFPQWACGGWDPALRGGVQRASSSPYITHHFAITTTPPLCNYGKSVAQFLLNAVPGLHFLVPTLHANNMQRADLCARAEVRAPPSAATASPPQRNPVLPASLTAAPLFQPGALFKKTPRARNLRSAVTS